MNTLSLINILFLVNGITIIIMIFRMLVIVTDNVCESDRIRTTVVPPLILSQLALFLVTAVYTEAISITLALVVGTVLLVLLIVPFIIRSRKKAKKDKQELLLEKDRNNRN